MSILDYLLESTASNFQKKILVIFKNNDLQYISNNVIEDDNDVILNFGSERYLLGRSGPDSKGISISISHEDKEFYTWSSNLGSIKNGEKILKEIEDLLKKLGYKEQSKNSLHESVRVGFHGSPNKFDKFNTVDIFLAKDEKEARRYGQYLYRVEYEGNPKFETSTIKVIRPNQVKTMTQIDYNANQVIYRT